MTIVFNPNRSHRRTQIDLVKMKRQKGIYHHLPLDDDEDDDDEIVISRNSSVER